MLQKYAASSIESILTRNESNWNIEIESDLKCRVLTSGYTKNYRDCSGKGETNGCSTANDTECSRAIKVRFGNSTASLYFKYTV